AVSEAIYKRWIPNTNFENASNWNERRVPCSQDTAMFPRDKTGVGKHCFKATLQAKLIHYVTPSAGFEGGTHINFHDAERHEWFDPTLWSSAQSTDDLEIGRFLFSVDAEHVPCLYDDVIFSPETSFRVDLKETGSEVQLRSISVLGKKFTNNADFSQYLKSPTGKLQFPGPVQPQIMNLRCQDDTGCLCGNDEMLQEICSARLQYSGNKCPEVTCASPLQPIGHCCGICGVIISLEYFSAFNLETYRNRLIHTFLSLNKYSSIKLAISKVQSSLPILSSMRFGKNLKIQIVLIDGKEGSLAGSDALQLGYDIMADIETQGESFGITKAEMEFATGSITSPQTAPMSAAAISGIVIGTFLGLSLLAASYFLYKLDACRLQYFRFFHFWNNGSRMEDDEPVGHGGFDNVIYEPAAENKQAVTGGEEDLKAGTGFQFDNPVFDSNFDA
ncbi:hypothetical protein GDO78_010865, partial [Eleutherodactylus coqui]